ncbi:A/B/D/E cyclin [Saitoella complicata NRRL Y-17804]|nr:A/B/D/E cyclin [Saitoella complicata NRRL Y-17804]ODQ54349.1 A/B/D/E cyclin [Saitoella complicata NRRL Y-17804]
MDIARRTRSRVKNNDENAAPRIPMATKNVMATKPTTTTVGLKTGAKRAALGDLSNAVKQEQQKSSIPVKAIDVARPRSSRVPLAAKTNVMVQKEEQVDVKPNLLKKSHTVQVLADASGMDLDDEEETTSAEEDLSDEDIEEDQDLSSVGEHSVGAFSGNSIALVDHSITMNIDPHMAGAFKLTHSQAAELRAVQDQFVDEHDPWDTTMVSEYSDEIFSYMKDLEMKMLPNPRYMEHQTEIEWHMRAVLVDWLVQVHARFRLLPETLYLCINYVDRFLSLKVVSLQKLQLVGAAALFVAAKYEEIQCPSVHEIVFMVDRGYTAEEVLKAERFMINMLNFELGWPGPMSFLRRISKADDYDLDTRTLAKYLMEVTLCERKFVGAPPSFVAAVAHYLARTMLGKSDEEGGIWTEAHLYYSGYTQGQLDPAVECLIDGMLRQPKVSHRSVYEKYADRKFKKASRFVEEWMKGRY